MLSNAELVAWRISRQLNRPLTHMMEIGPPFLAQYVESACLTKKSLESEVVGAKSCFVRRDVSGHRSEPMFPTTAAVIAILAICALSVPVYAQSQQLDTVKLKADA